MQVDVKWLFFPLACIFIKQCLSDLQRKHIIAIAEIQVLRKIFGTERDRGRGNGGCGWSVDCGML